MKKERTFMDKAMRIFKEPRRVCLKLLNVFAVIFPDALFLRLKFYLMMGKRLNLEKPETFSEKLQWLKLYNRKPVHTVMVDKIAAKDYVAKIVGKEHIIPTIATYDSVEEIDWDALPNQFVIKCTHDSGGVVVCKDKSRLDIEAAKKTLREGLRTDYYYLFREWPYRNVPRRLICEEYLVDESGYELKDYKWFCFDGEPKALFVAADRGKADEEVKFDFFDTDFNHLPFRNGHPLAGKPIAKPAGFEKMKELAAMLSKGEPHIRVDLYDVNGKVYFGELTFFHFSGLMPFEPEEWDYRFGSWLTLPQL